MAFAAASLQQCMHTNKKYMSKIANPLSREKRYKVGWKKIARGNLRGNELIKFKISSRHGFWVGRDVTEMEKNVLIFSLFLTNPKEIFQRSSDSWRGENTEKKDKRPQLMHRCCRCACARLNKWNRGRWREESWTNGTGGKKKFRKRKEEGGYSSFYTQRMKSFKKRIDEQKRRQARAGGA